MTGSIEQRLAERGIKIPSVAPAAANYLPFTRRGALITTSGQLSRTDYGLITGTLGNGTSIDRGVAAAQQCAVAIFAGLNEAIKGDLD